MHDASLLFDAAGNHVFRQIPPLDFETFRRYLADRPAKWIVGADLELPLAISRIWFLPDYPVLIPEKVWGDVIATLDGGGNVEINGTDYEAVKWARDTALSMTGGGNC